MGQRVRHPVRRAAFVWYQSHFVLVVKIGGKWLWPGVTGIRFDPGPSSRLIECFTVLPSSTDSTLNCVG